MHVHLYLKLYNICTKFERKLTKHVQDTTHKQYGCQSAIFDPIAKQIVMNMYPKMNYVCTKFEQKLTKHVHDNTHFQKTRWLPVGHIDPIAKQINMDMYPNMNNVCNKLNEN